MLIIFFSKMKLLIKTNGSYSRLEISFLGVTKVAFVPCWTLSHKLGLWGNCSLWPLMACKTGVRVFKSNFFAIVVTIWWIRQYTLLMVYIYGVIKSPCRLVYLLLNFWRQFLCFLGGFFSESSVHICMVRIQEQFVSKVGYDGAHMVVTFNFWHPNKAVCHLEWQKSWTGSFASATTMPKGQLISEWFFGVFKSSKKWTFSLRFLP